MTHVDAGLRYFYLDDGSVRDDLSGHLGLRVFCGALATGNTISLPRMGDFVRVTGVLSTQNTESATIPVLKPRSQSDIEVLPVPNRQPD